MKVTFLGGGSLRLPPIIRGIFSNAPAFFVNGEICLIDRELSRAEAVGKLILACPEYRNINCNVVWSDDLDSSLPGTDVMYLTMGARRQPTHSQAMFLANKYGYIYTDNLSINGAFLSLRLGRTILNIARKMEQYCPDALMLLFPNPVAVYSHLVNTNTKIKALGICGGFSNHRWDLTRILGRNECDPLWDVVAAGVNHMSIILRGTYNGEDMYEKVFPGHITENWKILPLPNENKYLQEGMEHAQLTITRMFKRYGKVIFSTESDGTACLFPDDELSYQYRRYGLGEDFDPIAAEEREKKHIRKSYDEFIYSANNPATVDWNTEGGLYGKCVTDITIPVFKALSGEKKMRIVATRPNYGAVKGFADDIPLEYTMDIQGKEIIPVEDQYIPAPFYGLVASLAEFQYLQSEAIAKWDPELFANALDAYPLNRFSDKRKDFFREMFRLFSDLDPHMLQAEKYFV